jgi:hypothetical protein
MSLGVMYHRQNLIEFYCKRRLLIPGILLYHSNEDLLNEILLDFKETLLYLQPASGRT